MGRNPCCDKEYVKRGPWTAEEDAVLKEYIEKHGGHGGSWTKFPKKAGLNRCGKSCRLRWINYLKPNLKLGRFSELEEITINYWVNLIGKKWSVIATFLPGRTDNDIKNYWKIKTRKEATAASSSATQNENGNVLVNISPQEPTFENVSNNAFYSDPGNQTFLQNHCPGDTSVFNIPSNSFLSPPQHFPSNNYPVIHQPDCCNLNAVENYSYSDMVSGAVEDQELVGLSGEGWGQIPDKNNSYPEPMSGAVGVQALVGFFDRGWSQIPDELNTPGAFSAIENVGFNQLSDCKQNSLGIENNYGMDSIYEAAGDPSMLQPDFYYPNLIANNSGMNSMFVAAGNQEFLGFSGGWGTSYVGTSKGGSHGLHDIQESSFGQFQCSNDKVFDTDAGSYGFSNMSVNATSLMPELYWNKDDISSLF